MAIPFAGGGFGEFFSRPGSAEVKAVIGRVDFVSPGYLEALHTRLRGGSLPHRRRQSAEGAARCRDQRVDREDVLSKGDAIGQTMNVRSEVWQVVGVIADVVDRRLDVPRGAFAYVPSAFNPSRFAVAMRTPLDPLGLVASVRSEVARIDPGVAVARPRALDQAMAESMSERRVVLALVGTFAVTALALGGDRVVWRDGVYSGDAAARVRRPHGVRRHCARPHSSRACATDCASRARAWSSDSCSRPARRRLLSTQLYQVRGSDPLVIAGTAVMVIIVAVLACLLPAWRASRFDLTTALRD